MQIEKTLKNERLLKALTGVNLSEFNSLLKDFTLILEKKAKRRKRQRAAGGGRIGKIKPPANKLFYILFYLKVYPTFDVAGFVFNSSKTRAHEWKKDYLSILEKTLGKKCALPKRKINSVEEFLRLFPEAKEIIPDGTERRRQRPKKGRKQKKCYSGKKKAHTVKNMLIASPQRRIDYLGKTVPGKEHDYAIFKKEKLPQVIPKKVKVRVDLAFQGIETDSPELDVDIPKKKPRGKPLPKKDKLSNRKKASKRIKVEHAIGGTKRYRCLTDVFRNKKDKLADQFMLICSGLWNFHLGFQID